MRSDGIVVTNCHVVEGGTKITVSTSAKNPQSYDARVIGGDCEHDLAVLKIDGNDLPTVPLGNSSDLALGQRVDRDRVRARAGGRPDGDDRHRVVA